MTDIVQRLRLVDPNQVLLMEPPYDARYLHAGLICHEAAAEIERLRVEVLAEREACAKRCERVADDYIAANGQHAAAIAYECAVAIRAKGEP